MFFCLLWYMRTGWIFIFPYSKNKSSILLLLCICGLEICSFYQKWKRYFDMTNMIFLVNALSHLEMRKALAQVKSHLLSMESIILAYIYIYICIYMTFFRSFKAFLLWNKLPVEFKPFSLTKKKVILWYSEDEARIPRDLQTLLSVYVLCCVTAVLL